MRFVAATSAGNTVFSAAPDDHGRRARHATLARTAKRGFDDAARGIFHVRVRHEDDVILRAAVGLHPLAVLRPHFVNVPRNRRRAHERNRLHLRMGEQRLHDLASALHEVQHPFREAGLLQQLCDLDRRERNFLARFEHKRVSAGKGHRIHPQRLAHAGKVERRDARANAQRLAQRLAINPTRDVLEHLPHQQRRHAARKLDHLDAALHVPARLGERFAVLAGVAPHQLVEVFFEQLPELEQNARALDRRRFHPRRKRRLGCRHRGVRLRRRADGTFGDDFADGRIENRGAGELGFDPFATDEMRTRFNAHNIRVGSGKL